MHRYSNLFLYFRHPSAMHRYPYLFIYFCHSMPCMIVFFPMPMSKWPQSDFFSFIYLFFYYFHIYKKVVSAQCPTSTHVWPNPRILQEPPQAPTQEPPLHDRISATKPVRKITTDCPIKNGSGEHPQQGLYNAPAIFWPDHTLVRIHYRAFAILFNAWWWLLMR